MDLATDRAALQLMTDDLEAYLLSEVDFWPLSGLRDYARLSLGIYSLTRQRLLAAPPSAKLTALNERGEATLAHWRTNAEKKAAKEMRMRVRLWSGFVDVGRGRYATEVAQRAMVGLLVSRYPRLRDLADGQRLATLDIRLRDKYPAGPFVWDAQLQPAFSADEFWYLYRKGPSG